MSTAAQLTFPADKVAFGALVERYRRELQVHCYRMLGSFEDSEDIVQETFLRAWRKRASFSFDGSSIRAWLYRIATNACLDVLRGRPPGSSAGASARGGPGRVPFPPDDLPWLQPYPDRLLEVIAPAEGEPASVVVARETIELSFLAAIQHLTPRQRAVLILRDVVGWSAKETARLLETSVVSVNSACCSGHERRFGSVYLSGGPIGVHPRCRARKSASSYDAMWTPMSGRTWTLADLLREDAILTMPPLPTWYAGREAILIAAQRASTRPSATSEASSPARICNRQPRTTCERRATRRTGRWPSTCFESKADASSRSAHSSTPSCFRRSAFPDALTSGNRLDDRTGEFLADPRFNN